MTGHAMPWNKDLSGQQKTDLAAERALQQKQNELADKQEAQMNAQKQKLNEQQIAMLRARYGTSSSNGGTVNPPTDSPSSLFSMITGR